MDLDNFVLLCKAYSNLSKSQKAAIDAAMGYGEKEPGDFRRNTRQAAAQFLSGVGRESDTGMSCDIEDAIESLDPNCEYYEECM